MKHAAFILLGMAVSHSALAEPYSCTFETFAMSSCTRQFAKMTPEEIGVNREPFFPREMLAAMVRVGREVICPSGITQ